MKDAVVDIVIPTVGRPSLGRLLESLASSAGPLPAKVFLMDDRKERRVPLSLPTMPEEWQGRIVTLRGGSAGPAAARNAGWRTSSAAWVAFLDDDVVVGADWLRCLFADLAGLGPGIGGSQGQVSVPLPQDRRPCDWERNVAGLENARWITADMAYRQTALEAVDGFDERFGRAYREDADLAIRVKRAGYDLVQGSRRVVHPVGPSSFWTSVKLQAGNADDALMRRLHGPNWRAHAEAGKSRMPVHVASTCAAAAAALGRGNLRYAGLLLWPVLTGRFAWQRIAVGPKTGDEVLKMIVTSAFIPPAAAAHRLLGAWKAGETQNRTSASGRLPSAEGSQYDLERRRPGSRRKRRPPASTQPAIPFHRATLRAVLFDRDGTLVEDVPYNGDPEKVRLKAGAAEAVERLRKAGIATGVVSNQSGVARGLLTTAQVRSVNRRIEQLLGPLEPWVTCEHGPEDKCRCRKPEPGMILEAARRLGVAPEECVVVGDIGADVDAARKAGAASILVPGPATRPQEIAEAPLVARRLPEAVDLIIARAHVNGGAE